MLEHEKGDESGHCQHEKRDVGIDGGPIVEESSAVFEENSLQFDFIGVEEEHAEDDDHQYEADYGDGDFPASVRVIETA